MSVYRSGKKWKAELWLHNRRLKTKSGFKTKAEALRWRTQSQAELMQNSTSGQRTVAEEKTFDELIERYSSIHLPTIRVETVRRYRIDLEKRIKPYFQFFKLSNVTPGFIEEFRASLISSGLSAKSINNCTDLLRSMLNKALKWGWIDKSPYRMDRLKVDHKPYSWWDDKSEIRLFLSAIKHDPYEAAFRLGLEYGLRLGEIVGLSKQDISFDLGQIHIHRQWNEKERCYTPTKHNRSRYLSFDPKSDFGNCLQKAVNSSPDPEIIFVTQSGERVLNRRLAGGVFQNRVKRAGVPRIRFHDLRHSFASWFMIQRGDIWALMQILGHSNIATTMKYAHHSGKHQKAPNLNWGEEQITKRPLSIPSLVGKEARFS